jgi:Tfp pilus assembly protein PilF
VQNYGEGQYQAALKELTKAIAEDEDSKVAHIYRAFTLHALKRYPEAVEEYSTTIALDGTDAHAFKGRGMAYHQLKKYK